VESPPGRRRNSLRLPEYDYAQQGLYYVTTVALERRTLFGIIDKGRMDANSVGRLVTESLLEVPKRFPNARIESYVLMPNHIHILLQVHGDECPIPVTQAAIEETHDCRLVGAGSPRPRPALGQIVGFFKYLSTKRANETWGTAGFHLWQRGYHERVVRDEWERDRIREYIATNPLRWELDRENPARNGTSA
jgi:putative transposase